MEHELADLDGLFRKFNGQLERLETHAKHNLMSAKNQDLEIFLTRLTDLDIRLSQLSDHLKSRMTDDPSGDSGSTDDQLLHLKSLNSALNRRAVLHRIEKEFDQKSTGAPTPLAEESAQDASKFDWSEKIKQSQGKKNALQVLPTSTKVN